MVDPLGALLAYLVDNAAGTALEGVAIRGGNLEPGDEPPVLLLMEAGGTHERSVPWQSVRVEITAFGPLGAAGPRIASELYRTAAALLHGEGPVTVDDTTIGRMFEEMGPQHEVDAATRWPSTYGVIDIEMPDRALG